MLKKISIPALALLALLALVPLAAHAADTAPVPASADGAALQTPAGGGCSAAAASADGAAGIEWLSALGEDPIGAIPYPCEGAVYQYRWNFVGCCGPFYNRTKAESEQEERFCCPDGSCSVWYKNGQTKCEGTCL